MNANMHLTAAKLLLLAMALCLGPALQADDSKRCNWPNDAAQGLVCLVDQNTPLLPNGTTKDKPARICTHGPNPLDLLDDGCHELWYDLPGESDALPVPWKRGDFETFLPYLEARANSVGKEAGWCLAERPAPYKVKGKEEDTTDDEGNPVLAVTYKCEGHLRSCETGAEPECIPGEDRVVHEPACDKDAWSPDPSTVDAGVEFEQTNECGTPRPEIGTKPVANLHWVATGEVQITYSPRSQTLICDGCMVALPPGSGILPKPSNPAPPLSWRGWERGAEGASCTTYGAFGYSSTMLGSRSGTSLDSDDGRPFGRLGWHGEWVYRAPYNSPYGVAYFRWIENRARYHKLRCL